MKLGGGLERTSRGAGSRQAPGWSNQKRSVGEAGGKTIPLGRGRRVAQQDGGEHRTGGDRLRDERAAESLAEHRLLRKAKRRTAEVFGQEQTGPAGFGHGAPEGAIDIALAQALGAQRRGAGHAGRQRLHAVTQHGKRSVRVVEKCARHHSSLMRPIVPKA